MIRSPSPMSPRATPKLLLPTNDAVFKLLFVRNQGLLRSMLGNVLGRRVAKLTLLNPALPAEGPASKAITLDILVELADGTRVDVEMQVRLRPGFTGRAVYYLARNFTEPLRRGQDYGTLRPSVLVIWAVEPLFAERDGFHAVYELRDGNGNRFGEHLAIHVFELSKVREGSRPEGGPAEARSGRALRLWGEFLSATTRVEFERLARQDRTMAQAVGKLNELARDPEAVRLAERREDELRFYEMGLEESREAGERSGLAKGRREGKREGKREGERLLVAKQLRLKFGPLTEEVQARLARASEPELTAWAERILNAKTLDQVTG